MSKPKSHRRRKEARPAEIADAGFKEFAKHGFAGTRLDDVAARAGIAKGTIYLYFDSKQSLFEAAVLSRLGGVPDVVSSLISLYPGPTKPLLKQVFKQMYKTLAAGDLHVVMRIIIAEGDRYHGTVQEPGPGGQPIRGPGPGNAVPGGMDAGDGF